MDDGKLKEFFDLYKDKNLVSYVELILGLPMETVESFKDGIFQILDLEYNDFIGIYPMTALPNNTFKHETQHYNIWGNKIEKIGRAHV